MDGRCVREERAMWCVWWERVEVEYRKEAFATNSKRGLYHHQPWRSQVPVVLPEGMGDGDLLDVARD